MKTGAFELVNQTLPNKIEILLRFLPDPLGGSFQFRPEEAISCIRYS